MLRNYLITALRNLRKHKVFSFVNIAGLALGLAAFWVIVLYIGDELSYDRFNDKADRIVRVVHEATWDNGHYRLAPTAVPFGPAFKKDYPEVEQYARIDAEGGGILRAGEKQVKADDIIFTDNGIMSMFTYTPVAGDLTNALDKPQSIVITRSLAEKLFSSADEALGKNLQVDQMSNLITAVIEDIPANAHLRFSAMRSFPTNYSGDWHGFYVYTYLLLRKGEDYRNLQAKMGGFIDHYLKKENDKTDYRVQLQPLTAIHLHSDYDYEISANGNIRNIYIFSVVALLILVIACINYMNLATARSSSRTREIGVRKVIGSGNAQLVVMFLAESVLFTLVAAVIGAVLVNLALPAFNALSGKSLAIWRFGTVNTLLALAGFSLVLGVFSGLYPAFFLSRFSTVSSLKGQAGSRFSGLLFRKSLVTFQFVIAITLIAGSIVIYQQMRFVMSKDLGFNKDQVLTLHLENKELRTRIPALKEKLLQNPLLESVASASNPIGNNNIGANGYFFEQDGKMAKSTTMVQNFMADPDYIPTMEIKLMAGRNFSESFPTDQFHAAIINETLVKHLGWKDAIGKKLEYFGGPNNNERVSATVVGVVHDFNIYSLQHKVEPLLLRMPPVDNEKDNLYIRISKSNAAAALAYIQKTFQSFDSGSPFEYHFLDQNFANQYAAEQKQQRLLLIFTSLAIAIACLGLFGLVSFTAQQRTKEIGVRKVLGASVQNIVTLLSKDLLKLVIIASCIAIPISWMAMNKWLQDFAYRINISWWIFAAAGLLAIIIALVTLSFRAIRSALANPIKSLRTE